VQPAAAFFPNTSPCINDWWFVTTDFGNLFVSIDHRLGDLPQDRLKTIP